MFDNIELQWEPDEGDDYRLVATDQILSLHSRFRASESVRLGLGPCERGEPRWLLAGHGRGVALFTFIKRGFLVTVLQGLLKGIGF